MPTTTEIIDTLSADLALEHGAIFQYVLHAGQVSGTSLAEAVMDMAREEMWHLEWLAEAITERGGEPGLDRAPVFTSESVRESMTADVGAEDAALAHYTKTLGVIGDADPELTRLIERIVDDERHHRVHFQALADEVGRSGEQTYALVPVITPPEIPAAAQALGLEYEGLLRYLWSKYGCSEPEEAETFFELAVDEMRHGAWASSYLVGLGKPQAADVPADHVALPRTPSDARSGAADYERKAAATYERLTPTVANARLKDDFARATFQHDYHRFVLDHMGDGSPS